MSSSTQFQIIGLKSQQHANRVEQAFRNLLDGEQNLTVDYSHKQITLPASVDESLISMISSIEQVSIVQDARADNHTHSHEHGHHHHHHSHHHHHHGDHSVEKNMFIVFMLNLFFSVAEFVFGVLFNSQAILSDAVHDLGDAMSIGLAYIFEKISMKTSNAAYTYGYRRFSLLGALVTSTILITGAFIMIVNSAV